jgi:CheY-like chemotaxis protein
LRQLIEEELAPYGIHDGKKIVISARRVMLPPATAQTIALAIHELATNAAKYGALSSSNGTLTVTWVDENDAIKLVWEEHADTTVEPPASAGFGTRSVIVSVKSQLGGEVDFDWRPNGLRCTLIFPNAGQPPVKPERAVPKSRISVRPSVPPGGNRVLVVEDEALVALGMCELLGELGYRVVGPFRKTSDALPVVKESGADFAVLDINLGGEMAYPLADALMSNGVPFLFVTGYSDDAIEDRFKGVSVLQKPVARDALKSALEQVTGGAS